MEKWCGIECATLELKIWSDSFLFFCCYRPPTFSPTTFFYKLSDLLSLAEDSDKNYTVAVLGDFNAKHTSWDLNSTPNIAGMIPVCIICWLTSAWINLYSTEPDTHQISAAAVCSPFWLHRIQSWWPWQTSVNLFQTTAVFMLSSAFHHQPFVREQHRSLSNRTWTKLTGRNCPLS